MQQLLKEYPNDLKVVYKYYVVHQQAVVPGLAVCAGHAQGKFVPMAALIWAYLVPVKLKATVESHAGEANGAEKASPGAILQVGDTAAEADAAGAAQTDQVGGA